MRRLIEGTLDIGLMYTPSHVTGLVVEHLFDETLVLISSRRDSRWSGEDYICVDWGPGFYARHRESYPDLERPPLSVNIGWKRSARGQGRQFDWPPAACRPYLAMPSSFQRHHSSSHRHTYLP